MTSKIKVDNINKVSDDTNIIKKCGTTTTIGSGASNPIVVDGSAVTLGRCGGTVALASGATQTGFGRTGTVDWQTGSVKTANFTAVSGEGYFCNTSGGSFSLILPSSPSAGDIVALKDYALTFDSNALNIDRNGSKINGETGTSLNISTEGASIVLVFVDATKGWIPTQDDESSIVPSTPTFITATGGTITTVCTNFKVHTFTGPGTFTVCSIGNPAGSNEISYVVVAGAGGGARGNSHGGGGGAGGFREGKSPQDSYTSSPLACTSGSNNGIPVTAQGYPIIVGAGASGKGSFGSGNDGNNSSGFGITSAAGGGGGNYPGGNGGPGGSGGGDGGVATTGGTGNTPPVSPPQGTNGASGSTSNGAGGGGGATQAGIKSPNSGGDGGAGATTSINGSATVFAGGGGGGGGPGSDGGAGGGGAGGCIPSPTGTAGTANTGGGGGGNGPAPGDGAAGGSGIVIIRYKFQ